MENIDIATTQNVNISYKLAGIADRILALLLDWLIQAAYLITLFIVGAFLQSGFGMGIESFGLMSLLTLPLFLYEVIFESLMNGQTPGKKIRGIRVISMDGSEAGTGQFIIRWLLRFVDVTLTFGSVGLITLFINNKGQRLGDIAAGTTVVRIGKKSNLDDSLSYSGGENMPLTWPQARHMTPHEASLLNQVLNSKPESEEAYADLLSRTARVYAKKLNIDFPSSDNRAFLETLLRDYHNSGAGK